MKCTLPVTKSKGYVFKSCCNSAVFHVAMQNSTRRQMDKYTKKYEEFCSDFFACRVVKGSVIVI